MSTCESYRARKPRAKIFGRVEVLLLDQVCLISDENCYIITHLTNKTATLSHISYYFVYHQSEYFSD